MMPAMPRCGRWLAAEGVKAGLLINATRVAIVGRAVAPPALRYDGLRLARSG